MSDLTRAQKARLGLFLLFASGLLAIVIVVKVGQSLFDERDAYRVRMPGSVGALEPGSAVTFNGIEVGRVERVAIDPDDVAFVAIDLSLAGGTPIPEDARATVAMRGITGQKYVELTGGTNAARRRKPGEEIPAGRSLLDDLQDRAVGITAKLEDLLDQVHGVLAGPGTAHIEATLASVRNIAAMLDRGLTTVMPRVTSLLDRFDAAALELSGTLVEARAAVGTVRTGAKSFGDAMRTFDETSRAFGQTARNIDSAVERTTRLIEPLIPLVTSVVGRAGVDLRGALDELVQGFDSVGALADMLRADPSSLILGKSGKERELP